MVPAIRVSVAMLAEEVAEQKHAVAEQKHAVVEQKQTPKDNASVIPTGWAELLCEADTQGRQIDRHRTDRHSQIRSRGADGLDGKELLGTELMF